MKTDDLIRGLAADLKPTRGLGAGLVLSLAGGLLMAAALFAAMLNLRAGMPGLIAEPRILLKFAVTLSLAVAAAGTVLRLARPGADASRSARLLFLPVVLLGLGIGTEVLTTSRATWVPGLVGHYAIYCTVLVPTMAAPILGAILLALRRGAPSRPALTGAVAGLMAGGLGAALYALHCVDDSPLFLLAWYGLAIGIVTAAGALIGRRVLVW